MLEKFLLFQQKGQKLPSFGIMWRWIRKSLDESLPKSKSHAKNLIFGVDKELQQSLNKEITSCFTGKLEEIKLMQDFNV